MDNLKYFPFYYNRFMDGVRGYDAEFIGIYIMLLCRQAETHRIPKDLEKLSRWMGGVEVLKIENVLSEKFQCDDHGFFNLVMVEVLEEVAKKSESARKSVNTRWEKIRKEYERNTNVSKTYTKSHTNDILIKESKVNEIKVKEKKEGLVNKFTPPPLCEVIEYFNEKGFTQELAKRAFEFYDTANWIDSKGNKVKNWKQKMLSVWLKPENKETQPTFRKLKPEPNEPRRSNQPATVEQIISHFANQPQVSIKLGDYQHLIKKEDTGDPE
jgi:uncharacterized protein YdaU (DUF1376 family)